MHKDTPSSLAAPQTGKARMLAACHLRQPDATPIWFMRQAGRSLPEHQEMRKKYDVLTMAKTPELCAQVSLMPVQQLGVDAAVMYTDIMLPTEGMGISMELQEIGPIIHNPIRSLHDVEMLRVQEAEETVPFVLEAINMVSKELAGKQAVVGISGAPFTLACYLIEGQPTRDYALSKAFMYSQPQAWEMLMDKLSEVIANYLVAQIKAGADVIQLFDSWVSALSPDAYRRFVLPYTQRIFATVKQTGTPAIHFGTGTSTLLALMTEAGGDIISIDWRMELDDAWERIGYDHGLQGNLDPVLLLTNWPLVEAAMQDILRRANNRPGHIFNLGHGVLAQTNPDMLRRLVDAVHIQSRRQG